MKKHVVVVEAKMKLTHAMGTLNKANRFFGALANTEDGPQNDPANPGRSGPTSDEDSVPCGACEAIKVLKLDQDSDPDSEDEDDKR